jgi:tight adherence protein B
MPLVLLFIAVLLLTFVVLVYLLKPTRLEKVVAEQLSEFDKASDDPARPKTVLKDEALRSSTVADDVFNSLPWAPALENLVKQSGKDWRGSSVLLATIAFAGLVGWIVSMMVNIFIGVASAALVGVIPFIYLIILRDTRRRQFGNLLPEAVDLMSRGLRAGHSISAVLEMVGTEIADPVGLEFRALHKEQTLGLPIRDAMTNLIDRMPLDDMRFLATAILLQKESGGNLTQILDKTSAVVRERARLRGQIRIYTAQGRITGWILCAAPFIMFALISVVNHQYEKPLFTHKLGLYMIYGGLGLMVLGVLTIRKIIDIKV